MDSYTRIIPCNSVIGTKMDHHRNSIAVNYISFGKTFTVKFIEPFPLLIEQLELRLVKSGAAIPILGHLKSLTLKCFFPLENFFFFYTRSLHMNNTITS